MKNSLLICCLLLTNHFISSQVKLSSLFSDGMILQQNQSVAIWGEATPNTKVVLAPSWTKEKYATQTDDSGYWKINIQTPEASYTEYNISIKEKNTSSINKILIGEVWLCSGQSNMTMPMYGFTSQPVTGALEDIVSSGNKFIRHFNVERKSTTKVQNEIEGKWTEANPNTTGYFSATAYYFSRLLQKTLDVPVGVIHSSWGGSTIETWMSKEAISKFPGKNILTNDEDIKYPNRSACLLFNGMIAPVVGYGIKGMLWYQGEGNLTNYEEYGELFKTLYNDFHEKWAIGEFPIYLAQIAPYKYRQKGISPYMKEQQLKISEQLKKSGIAILLDAGDGCIHPANKEIAGHRLAYLALGKSYGFNRLPYMSPAYSKMEISSDTIKLFFNNAPRGLILSQKKPQHFQIANEARNFQNAQVVIDKSIIKVWSPDIKNPVAVRYAFSDEGTAELFSTEGLPVSSFRTDNW